MLENSIKTKATPKTTLFIMLFQLFFSHSAKATKLSFIGVDRVSFFFPLSPAASPDSK